MKHLLLYVVRLEAIRLLLALTCYYKFELFQMDAECAFLSGLLNEEVYVAQPKGFVDPHPDHINCLKKALYGLKMLKRTKVDMVAQIYVDDIMFGGYAQILVDQLWNKCIKNLR